MGLQHPSILSFSHDACKRATHRIIIAFPHLFEGSPATDPATRGTRTPYGDPGETLTTELVRACPSAILPRSRTGPANTATLRRPPTSHRHLGTAPSSVASQTSTCPTTERPCCSEHATTPASRHTSGTSSANSTPTSSHPPCGKTHPKLRPSPGQSSPTSPSRPQSTPSTPQPSSSPSFPTSRPCVHSNPSYAPSTSTAPSISMTDSNKHPSSRINSSARCGTGALPQKPHICSPRYSKPRNISSPTQSNPPSQHMTWEEWLHHAGLPQQQPAASSTHGEPTHQTTELLSIPPLDPDELRERTALTPPKTPTDAWPPVPANAGDTHLYGNAAQLKRRGWTDKLINDLLGAPDRTAPNPVYRSTARMRLYQRQRVEAAEQHPTFIQHLNKSANRRRTAAKASQHRRNDTHQMGRRNPDPQGLPHPIV